VNKNLLLGVAIGVFVLGASAVIISDEIQLRDILYTLKGLSPKVQGLLALPVIIILIFGGFHLRKKNEDRMWKKAMLKTRAKKKN
jgi:hypothetical protein